jgi:hypothetical protein
MVINPEREGVGGQNFVRIFFHQGTPFDMIRAKIGSGTKITPYLARPLAIQRRSRRGVQLPTYHSTQMTQGKTS